MRYLVKALGGRKEQDQKIYSNYEIFSGTRKGLESIKYKKKRK